MRLQRVDPHMLPSRLVQLFGDGPGWLTFRENVTEILTRVNVDYDEPKVDLLAPVSQETTSYPLGTAHDPTGSQVNLVGAVGVEPTTSSL